MSLLLFSFFIKRVPINWIRALSFSQAAHKFVKS